nr:MAG TPA: hypothetical protein [Bacteriophage sp.]
MNCSRVDRMLGLILGRFHDLSDRFYISDSME